MSRALTLGLLIALVVGAALRFPQLAIRPMHNDEAVNAIKLKALWEHSHYQYDPQEYHGPTLLYLTLAWMKLIGPADFIHFDEAQLRTVTVIFGLGLILLLPLIADGLGRRATICAGVFTALSPAMVFYSRYFIHEMLLVFFTFLAIAAGWRYAQNRKLAWALLAGASVGLMQATKETFVLAVAAAFVALVLNNFWSHREPNAATNFQYNFKHLAAALSVWLATVVILFTSFFTNASGPLDAIRTYLPWLHRVAGASPHIHPWNYYLERLIFFHSAKGPIWSETLILALAIIGIFTAAFCKTWREGNRTFIRFVAIYTVILTMIYSSISYKTPWCLLSFWHGMILLAGVGSVALINWRPQLPWKIATISLLVIGAAQLGGQAWQTSILYASDVRNPYAYAQTSPDILNLVVRLNTLVPTDAQKTNLPIKVIAPESEYWPLPWYLREFSQTGWWSKIPPDPYAPVMIVSTKFQANLDADKSHLMVGLYELRPQVFFELYVETNLWSSYVATRKPDE